MIKQYQKYLLDAIFDSENRFKKFVEHHVKSYSTFLDRDLKEIIHQFNPISSTKTIRNKTTIKGEVYFHDIYISKPQYKDENDIIRPNTPNRARRINESYTIDVRAKYTFKLYVGEENKPLEEKLNYTSNKLILLGKIPCMVMSNYCTLVGANREQLRSINENINEIGGYFIIKGNEFIIIPQDIKTPNKIYKNYFEGESKYTVWIQSKIPYSYKYPYYTEVKIYSNNDIFISVSVSKKTVKDIPASILLKAVGCVNDKEIYDLIGGDDLNQSVVKQMLLYDDTVKSQRDALLYIGKMYFKGRVTYKTMGEDAIIQQISKKLFDEELFPHIGDSTKLYEKQLLLGYMTRSCIRFWSGIEEELYLYDYGNKRVVTSGILFGQLFRHIYNHEVIRTFRKSLDKELSDYTPKKDYKNFVDKFYNHSKLENMEKNISNGEWPASGQAKGFQVRAGVSSNLARISMLDTLTTSQRIVTTSKKRGQEEILPVGVTKLDRTQWGYIDPYNTPDSKSVGKIKHKTMLSYISEYSDPSIIYKIIDTELKDICYRITKHKFDNQYNFASIFINGCRDYLCDKTKMKEVYHFLRDKRRSMIINEYVTIVYQPFEIIIYTDAGRLLRPLIIVYNEDGKNVHHMTKPILDGIKQKKYDMNYLLKNKIIEYVHGNEENASCYIAFDENFETDSFLYPYTHCEIGSWSIFDLTVFSIPYTNYNQGPRITFGCQMVKQAIGTYATNYDYRMDTNSYILMEPQTPLISTIAERYTGLHEYPVGSNLIVAIACAGENIEDSVITNKRTISKLDVYVYKIKSGVMSTSDEIIMKPDPNTTKHYKFYNSYDNIDKNGLPIIGRRVKTGDIIIGKVKRINRSVTEMSSNKQYRYEDRSKVYSEITDGIIESVIEENDKKNNKIIKVKIRLFRNFMIGDKLATRSSQKGTNSLSMNEEDMFYTEDGIVPDLIFNPHGQITRMTNAMPITMNQANIASLLGIRIDGTPFNGTDIRKDIIEQYKKLGMTDLGLKDCYNGITGKKMKHRIFVAPCYYQRLLHMVDDKVRARATGYYDHKTRQPGKGRTKGGGLKIGTMETDAIVSHGAISLLKEKFYEHSDGFSVYISRSTGFPCVGNDIDDKYLDKKDNLDIVKVNLPFVYLYLWTLLASTGITLRFNV